MAGTGSGKEEAKNEKTGRSDKSILWFPYLAGTKTAISSMGYVCDRISGSNDVRSYTVPLEVSK